MDNRYQNNTLNQSDFLSFFKARLDVTINNMISEYFVYVENFNLVNRLNQQQSELKNNDDVKVCENNTNLDKTEIINFIEEKVSQRQIEFSDELSRVLNDMSKLDNLVRNQLKEMTEKINDISYQGKIHTDTINNNYQILINKVDSLMCEKTTDDLLSAATTPRINMEIREKMYNTLNVENEQETINNTIDINESNVENEANVENDDDTENVDNVDNVDNDENDENDENKLDIESDEELIYNENKEEDTDVEEEEEEDDVEDDEEEDEGSLYEIEHKNKVYYTDDKDLMNGIVYKEVEDSDGNSDYIEVGKLIEGKVKISMYFSLIKNK